MGYTRGEKTLGERYDDHILNKQVGYSQVSDAEVVAAKKFFTENFGVRITTSEDLDALDNGVDAYYQRPQKDDIPLEAVQRAVMLKQKYYPISSYNKGPWDQFWFKAYPPVAAIPSVDYGQPPVKSAPVLSEPAPTPAPIGNTGVVQSGVPTTTGAGVDQPAAPEGASTEVGGTPTPSKMDKVKAFAKKKWWLAALPVVVAVPIIIYRMHKSKAN